MVSTTVGAACSVHSGLLSSSAVGSSSVSPLPLHGDTVSEDVQGPMVLIREKYNDVTLLVVPRLSDLESVCNDLAVASATENGQNVAVAILRSGSYQPRGEGSFLTSKVGSALAPCDELDLSWKRSADRNAETDGLAKVPTSIGYLLEGGLGGFDGQY